MSITDEQIRKAGLAHRDSKRVNGVSSSLVQDDFVAGAHWMRDKMLAEASDEDLVLKFISWLTPHWQNSPKIGILDVADEVEKIIQTAKLSNAKENEQARGRLNQLLNVELTLCEEQKRSQILEQKLANLETVEVDAWTEPDKSDIQKIRISRAEYDRLSRVNTEQLKWRLAKAIEVLEMVKDHRKMPHQHADAYTKLCCLTERASEALGKIKR